MTHTQNFSPREEKDQYYVTMNTLGRKRKSENQLSYDIVLHTFLEKPNYQQITIRKNNDGLSYGDRSVANGQHFVNTRRYI